MTRLLRVTTYGEDLAPAAKEEETTGRFGQRKPPRALENWFEPAACSVGPASSQAAGGDGSWRWWVMVTADGGRTRELLSAVYVFRLRWAGAGGWLAAQ